MRVITPVQVHEVWTYVCSEALEGHASPKGNGKGDPEPDAKKVVLKSDDPTAKEPETNKDKGTGKGKKGDKDTKNKDNKPKDNKASDKEYRQ